MSSNWSEYINVKDVKSGLEYSHFKKNFFLEHIPRVDFIFSLESTNINTVH
jgi:hypothetical protein